MVIPGITLTSLLLWLGFGFIVGIVVRLIDPGDVRGGAVGTTILGMLGALAGGLIARYFFGLEVIGFNLQAFLFAIAGGLLLALLHRLAFRNTGRIRTTTRTMNV